MTQKQKNILYGTVTITVVYVATLWQRPLFAPLEYDFAANSIFSTDSFASMLNGLFGKALGFNIVSVRLLPALCTILSALCVRFCGKILKSDNFGNICAVVYLANFLTFATGTFCGKEMICSCFFTAGVTAALAAVTLEHRMFFRILLGIASGFCAGFFALSCGFAAAIVPAAAVIMLLAVSKKDALIPAATTVAGCAVCGIWMTKYPLPLLPALQAFSAGSLLWLIPAILPWGVLFFQAGCAIRNYGRNFFALPQTRCAVEVTLCAALCLPFTGIVIALLMTLPFLTIVFVTALDISKNDRKLLDISKNTLKTVSFALLVFTAVTVVLCCLKSVPARWKLYYSKPELAGFAVAVVTALIQFKTAVDKNTVNGAEKLLHIATGAAILMILLPGAVPQKIKDNCAPGEFFSSIAIRYIPADAELYADAESINAVRWIMRGRKVILITKKSVHPLAERLKKDLPTAVFSTNNDFTKVLPKTKILFSKAIWKVVVCQTKGRSIYERVVPDKGR